MYVSVITVLKELEACQVLLQILGYIHTTYTVLVLCQKNMGDNE